MAKYSFDEIVNRLGTSSVKWDVAKDEIPMWVADMDFHVLPEIKEAIINAANNDAYGYVKCPKEYFEAYEQWWNHKHNANIKTSDMIYCTGVVAAIDSMFKHILKPGDGVVVFEPVYHVFFNSIKNNGLVRLTSPLIYKDNDYFIDFDNLESLLMDGMTKCLLLCNPHNPVGRIWSLDELKKVSSLCEKYNVLIVSDEIHCDITEPGYSYNTIFKVNNNAIALWSPSKAFNLAGVQGSVIACKNKVMREKIQEGVWHDDIGEPNTFSAPACIAALTKGEEWNKECNEYVFKNKKYVQDFLAKELPELSIVDNKATYLLWLNISHYCKNSKQFAHDLREKTGLYISNGVQFGKGGETFIRINIATSLEVVKEACERLKNYVKTLQK